MFARLGKRIEGAEGEVAKNTAPKLRRRASHSHYSSHVCQDSGDAPVRYPRETRWKSQLLAIYKATGAVHARLARAALEPYPKRHTPQ